MMYLRYYLLVLLFPWGLFSWPFCPGIGGTIAFCYLLDGEPMNAALWFFLPPLPIAWLFYLSDKRKP